MAFILGVLPLVLAKWADPEMRRNLGIAVFTGMLGVTFFGVFQTPVFYDVLQWLSEKWSGEVRHASTADAAPAAGTPRTGRPATRGAP